MEGAILFLTSLAAFMVGGRTTTIRIPHVFGTDVITFDPSRVSPAELRRWLRISPVLGTENNYVVPEDVNLCKSDDTRYEGCGKEQTTLNFHNAQLNIDAIRRRIHELEDPAQYPPDLSEVVSYLRHVQSFGLWSDTRLLEFAKTGRVSALESKFSGIDPRVICPGTLRDIAHTTDPAAAFQKAWHDWYNCLWSAELAKIGQYPQRAWERFLSAHGIAEHDVQGPAD